MLNPHPIPGIRPITLFAALLLFVTSPDAFARCVQARGNVCGDNRICVSDRRPEGKKDPNDCLPQVVCQSLKKLADQYGGQGQIEILAADRKRNCASRGGAGCSSMHAKGCRAVDVFVPGSASRSQQKSSMLPLVRQIQSESPDIRYNIYCTGTLHLDDSHRRPGLGNSYQSCVEGSERHSRYQRARRHANRRR